MMAELLLSSASSWMNGGWSLPLSVPSSFSNSSTTPALLEVALLFGPSLRWGGGAAPVHHMGGGPRTFPGGVTKWQWRRMQLKKSRQIEKARLLREKHMYEARRRAELLAASPVLEMPWQKMSRVRPPNYVTADEQVTKLAARFQKRDAEDLWTEKDGPESFEVLNDDSLPQFSTTTTWNQDKNLYNLQNGTQSNEQWNRVQDAGPPSRYPSFRQFPPRRCSSPSHSESSYEEISRRPQTQAEERWNRELDDRSSSYFRYNPRIRPSPTPHREPWNRVQDARPSTYSQYNSRIRPDPTSHPEPWNRVHDARPPTYSQCNPRIKPDFTSHPEPFMQGSPRRRHR